MNTRTCSIFSRSKSSYRVHCLFFLSLYLFNHFHYFSMCNSIGRTRVSHFLRVCDAHICVSVCVCLCVLLAFLLDRRKKNQNNVKYTQNARALDIQQFFIGNSTILHFLHAFFFFFTFSVVVVVVSRFYFSPSPSPYNSASIFEYVRSLYY